MKVVFVGPTLHGAAAAGDHDPAIDLRPPARQGDIARAVVAGATMIGLIDGRYEDVAAPWHKEILFALDRGVAVLGAASMGALRAAECAAYGMVPVGIVAARYLAGELTDDAAVAQIHAPPELGCAPLTDALVNIEATLDLAETRAVVAPAEAAALRRTARDLFFKDRTLERVIDDADLPDDRKRALRTALPTCWRDVKREDATLLIDLMGRGEAPARPPVSWSFRQTSQWADFMDGLQRSAR